MNQLFEYLASRVSFRLCSPVLVTAVMLSGKAPGDVPAQLSFSAFTMCIQNSTSSAFTGSPFDHFHGFNVIFTLRPSDA